MKPIARQKSSATLVGATKRTGFDTPMKRLKANNFEATQKVSVLFLAFNFCF
jgi:hypothetical protein